MDMEAGMDMHLGLQKGVALLEVGQLRLELLNGCKDLCIALVALAHGAAPACARPLLLIGLFEAVVRRRYALFEAVVVVRCSERDG